MPTEPEGGSAMIARIAGVPMTPVSRRFLWPAAIPLALGMAVFLFSCGTHGPNRAGTGEIRLTQGKSYDFRPRFSVDGRTIAYTSRSDSTKGKLAVYLMPREGGQPRRLPPDTLAVTLIGWSADGQALYVRGSEDKALHLISLDGTIRKTESVQAMEHLVSISPDGLKRLVLKFNGDNFDLALRAPGEEGKILEATPNWEEDGCFGPGPDGITAVSRGSYQAPLSVISVWSPATRTFSQLPLGEAQNACPAWSRDGRFMAYTSNRTGRSELWIYDATTARAVQVTAGPEDISCPDWSPDARWLVFSRATRTSHIFVGNPETFERRQITDGPDRDHAPLASPDGRWVTFVRRGQGGDGKPPVPQLCVVPAAGGAVRVLDLAGLTLSAKSSEMLCWSPDGKEIAFTADDGTGNLDIHRIPREGGRPVRVTLDPGEEIQPRWSPDGRLIGYTRIAGGETQICVIPATGGVAERMSSGGKICESSVWAPDSDRLAYFRLEENGLYQIWQTSMSSREQRKKIAESKEVVFPLGWSGDGGSLVVARPDQGAWALSTINLETGAEMRIGHDVVDERGKTFFVKFTDEGKAFRNIVCPGGTCTFADGDETSRISLLPVGDLLESRLMAGRGN